MMAIIWIRMHFQQTLQLSESLLSLKSITFPFLLVRLWLFRDPFLEIGNLICGK